MTCRELLSLRQVLLLFHWQVSLYFSKVFGSKPTLKVSKVWKKRARASPFTAQSHVVERWRRRSCSTDARAPKKPHESTLLLRRLSHGSVPNRPTQEEVQNRMWGHYRTRFGLSSRKFGFVRKSRWFVLTHGESGRECGGKCLVRLVTGNKDREKVRGVADSRGESQSVKITLFCAETWGKNKKQTQRKYSLFIKVSTLKWCHSFHLKNL